MIPVRNSEKTQSAGIWCWNRTKFTWKLWDSDLKRFNPAGELCNSSSYHSCLSSRCTLERRGPITYITSEYFNLTAHSLWQQCCDNTSGSDSTWLCKPPTKPFFEYIKGCLSTKPTHANLKMQGNIWLRRALDTPLCPHIIASNHTEKQPPQETLCISSIQEI